MATDSGQPTLVTKEMGLTHQEFYSKLPVLLADISYQLSNDTIRTQLNGKQLEITLAPELTRKLSRSISLPVTPISFRFFDFSSGEIEEFIKHFNLTYMKGGG